MKPFWNPLVTLILKGYVGIEETKKFEDEHEDDEIEEESAGIIDRKDKNMLLKPNMVKALKIALRALDVIAKERTTWSGPNLGTPVESPRGPTKLRDNSTLPDYDMRPRPGEDDEKPYTSGKKSKQKLLHTKIDSNGDESIVFEMKDGQPIVSID